MWWVLQPCGAADDADLSALHTPGLGPRKYTAYGKHQLNSLALLIKLNVVVWHTW